MAERYAVGRTPANRHVVEDTEQKTLVCLCATPGLAQKVVQALNRVEAWDRTIKASKQRLGIVGPTGFDSVATPEEQAEFVRSLHRELPPKPVPSVDVQAREYLADLFSFACRVAEVKGYADVDAIPAPPWLP